MKNLIFLLFLAILGFAVAGYFLDWYKIEGVPSGEGHRKLQIDINTTKIKDDFDRGTEKVQEGINHVKDTAEKTASKVEVPKDKPEAKKTNDSSFFEFLGRIGEKSGTKK
jgi:hypothetical protein